MRREPSPTRSRTRGQRTPTGPMPVMISRSGKWPWRTSRWRPSSVVSSAYLLSKVATSASTACNGDARASAPRRFSFHPFQNLVVDFRRNAHAAIDEVSGGVDRDDVTLVLNRVEDKHRTTTLSAGRVHHVLQKALVLVRTLVEVDAPGIEPQCAIGFGRFVRIASVVDDCHVEQVAFVLIVATEPEITDPFAELRAIDLAIDENRAVVIWSGLA